jgi:hypothetical protein
MQIESARPLMQEIAAEVVPPAVAAIDKAGGFSITTFSLSKETKARPLVALGVAPGAKKAMSNSRCVCSVTPWSVPTC